MSFTKWFIVVTVSGSLLFAAAKSPDKFPDVVAIGLPLLAQTLIIAVTGWLSAFFLRNIKS